MSEPGHAHEAAGEAFLLEHGVRPEIARFCRTHCMKALDQLELEDLLVALADTLWKGKRRQELEEQVIDTIAKATKTDRFFVFTPSDELFETIASRGIDRLARSDVSKSP